MLRVDIKQLISAIQEAPAFAIPETSSGTSYLLNNIYNPLSRGENVRLSDLDFNAFNSEDISTLNELYDDIFERSNYQADNIISTLRLIVPTTKATAYV